MKVFGSENIYFGGYFIPVTYKLEKLYRNKKLNKTTLFFKNQLKTFNKQCSTVSNAHNKLLSPLDFDLNATKKF